MHKVPPHGSNNLVRQFIHHNHHHNHISGWWYVLLRKSKAEWAGKSRPKAAAALLSIINSGLFWLEHSPEQSEGNNHADYQGESL